MVSCTIGIPKDDELERLKNTKDYLANEMLKNNRIQIIPAFFIGQPIDLLERFESLGIKVFDINAIKTLLHSLRTNEPCELFNYLTL